MGKKSILIEIFSYSGYLSLFFSLYYLSPNIPFVKTINLYKCTVCSEIYHGTADVYTETSHHEHSCIAYISCLNSFSYILDLHGHFVL
jgi:hypothetical protein